MQFSPVSEKAVDFCSFMTKSEATVVPVHSCTRQSKPFMTMWGRKPVICFSFSREKRSCLFYFFPTPIPGQDPKMRLFLLPLVQPSSIPLVLHAIYVSSNHKSCPKILSNPFVCWNSEDTIPLRPQSRMDWIARSTKHRSGASGFRRAFLLRASCTLISFPLSTWTAYHNYSPRHWPGVRLR